MFLGTYTPKLDDKGGRLTLPAKFRDALAGGLMVTKSQDHSLAVYPRDEFEKKLARRASQASRSNPEARAFLRNLAAATDEQHPRRTRPDHPVGRPPPLRQPVEGLRGDRIGRLFGDLGFGGMAGVPADPRRRLLRGHQ